MTFIIHRGTHESGGARIEITSINLQMILDIRKKVYI